MSLQQRLVAKIEEVASHPRTVEWLRDPRVTRTLSAVLDRSQRATAELQRLRSRLPFGR